MERYKMEWAALCMSDFSLKYSPANRYAVLYSAVRDDLSYEVRTSCAPESLRAAERRPRECAPANRTVSLYSATRRDIDAYASNVCDKEFALAAEADETRRNLEIVRVGERIASFLREASRKDDGERVIEILSRARIRELDLSFLSNGDTGPFAASQLKKLAILLEEEFGMPRDTGSAKEAQE